MEGVFLHAARIVRFGPPGWRDQHLDSARDGGAQPDTGHWTRQPLLRRARTIRVSSKELDDIDRGILHQLQENARDATIETMGERIGVSASTVRNRINEMEAAGIIEGYHPQINYAKAGFDLHSLYICKGPTEERARLAREILDISGVVEVHELLDSQQNLVIEAVARDADHLAATHDALVARGLTVRETLHVRNNYVQPFDHFGTAVPDD